MACLPGRAIPRLSFGGARRRTIPYHFRYRRSVRIAAVCLALAPAWRFGSTPARAAAEEAAAAYGATLPGLAWADTLVIVAGPVAQAPVPATAGVVTRLELGEEPAGRDLAALLGSTAGLQVRRLEADGASAIPSLRGGSAAQVRLFLDGMPLPDAWVGGAALDLVPVERLDAVEIHRGLVPAALGGVGGIGAINLLTRRVPAYPYAELAAGSFGARSLRAGSGWISADGLTSVDVAAHARRADNDFTYLDHNQTFHNTADDSLRTRVNARVRESGAWVGASRLAGRWALRAGGGYLRRDGGRPGPLTLLSPHASVRYERGDARLRADLDDGRFTVDVAAGLGDDRLDDPAGEVSLRSPGATRALAHDLGTRIAWTPRSGRAVSPSLGMTWRRQWQQDSFNGDREPQRRRTQTGMFAAVDLSAGRVRVTPAWRWQRTDDRFAARPLYPWSVVPEPVVTRDDSAPSVGAVWEAATGRLFFEAHAARARREPSWIELFGVRGGIAGNPALKPERIDSYDVAATWRPRRGGLDLRVAAFTAATEDKIIYRQNNQLTSIAENVGRAETRGLECEVAWKRHDHWKLSGNLTWQDARDRSGLPYWDGRPLPYLPPLEARLYAALSAADWEPWAEWTHQAENPRDRADTEIGRAPARTRLSLGLGRTLSAAWLGRGMSMAVTAAAENVFDVATYDVEGYPLPGRTWRLAVTLRNR